MTSTVGPVTLSPTLAINEEVARRRAAGLATLPLGFGEAGLPVLPELVDVLRDAATANGYGPVAGLPELRRAAAGYLGRRRLPTDPDLVVAGPGSKPLLFAVLDAVDGAVALPSPCWVSYAAQAALVGRAAHRIPTAPGQGGVPDPDLLDAAARAARAAGTPIGAVVVTLPDNPTGTLAHPSSITRLCAVAAEHDLLVISDEIYRDLVHDAATPFLSPAEVAGDRTVVTTGLSKNLAVGGWRLGIARLPDSALGRRLRGRILSTASEIWSAPAHPVQLAAAWAFTEPAEVSERVALSRRLHGAVAGAVSRTLTRAGIGHAPPVGGFYLYPDLENRRDILERTWGISTGSGLARVLLDSLGVATLPGVAFGEPERTLTLRIATSLLYGRDDEQRLTALHHAEPQMLPWISASLETLAGALEKLVPAG